MVRLGKPTPNIITGIGKDMDKLKPLNVAGENVKWRTCFVKQAGNSRKC